jgi:hypothetical protein
MDPRNARGRMAALSPVGVQAWPTGHSAPSRSSQLSPARSAGIGADRPKTLSISQHSAEAPDVAFSCPDKEKSA